MSISNEQLVSLIKKNPIGVICGIIILTLAAVLYFGSDRLPESERILKEKSAEGQKLANNLKNATQLKEQLETMLASNKAIDNRLIHSSQLMMNNQYFYKLESETDVKLIDMKQTMTGAVTPAAGKKYAPISFSVNGQGTYPQILTFLQHLENGAHFSRVIAITCSPVGVDRGARISTNLTVELLGVP